MDQNTGHPLKGVLCFGRSIRDALFPKKSKNRGSFLKTDTMVALKYKWSMENITGGSVQPGERGKT